METVATDGGTAVDPTDRDAVRANLEQFAGTDAVEERDDGTLHASFSARTHVTVTPSGRVESGMPLHAFDGPADRLVFDHDAGELHVERASGDETVSYTFRRP